MNDILHSLLFTSVQDCFNKNNITQQSTFLPYPEYIHIKERTVHSIGIDKTLHFQMV